MSHHKIDLIIIASFRQSKNLNSFRFPVRWLWKDIRLFGLWIWQKAYIFNGIFNESLFPLNSVRITGERVRRVVSEGNTNVLKQKKDWLWRRTWVARCWDSQWRLSDSHRPYQTCSQTMKPGCRRDWKLFCISSQSWLLPTQWRITFTYFQSKVDVVYHILVS